MTDQELWSRILKNDENAWNTLIEKYKALVYSIASRSGLSMAETADCFQATWVSLYEYRKKIKNPERISAWLSTTTKREVLKLKKHNKREIVQETDNDNADPSILADDQIIQMERESQLHNGLQQLKERCRKLLTLFFFEAEEVSYESIAKSLNMSINSLGPIKRRCLDKLREILKKNDL